MLLLVPWMPSKEQSEEVYRKGKTDGKKKGGSGKYIQVARCASTTRRWRFDTDYSPSRHEGTTGSTLPFGWVGGGRVLEAFVVDVGVGEFLSPKTTTAQPSDKPRGEPSRDTTRP